MAQVKTAYRMVAVKGKEQFYTVMDLGGQAEGSYCLVRGRIFKRGETESQDQLIEERYFDRFSERKKAISFQNQFTRIAKVKI